MLKKKNNTFRSDVPGTLTKNLLLRLAVACSAIFATTISAAGQSVHLQWDANAEPDLAGYRVYRSLTSGSSYSPLNLSLVAAPDFTDEGAVAGATNYYVVTAVNTNGLESGFSNQIGIYIEAAPAPNQDPTVSAGPDQQKREGRQVTLHGSGSDPDGDALTYHWTQTSGPAAALADASSASTSFIAPAVAADTDLVFQLMVDDGRGGQAVDSSRVTVQDNRPPLVQASADQTVDFGQTVQLAGTATDPDGDPLTYSWLQTAGSPVSLSGAGTPSATFTAPSTEETLVFLLVASDDELSGSDSVQVTVTNLNDSPVADAGPDLQVRERRSANLAGVGTDLNGDSLSYHWSQMSGPAAVLTTPDQAQTEIQAPSVDADTALVFQLMVEDPRGAKGTDEVNVLVTANRSPEVGAGPDRTADFLENVQLNGTASDPDSDPLTYRWVQTSGTPVTLSGADSLSAAFAAPESQETLVFQLTVSDDEFSVSDTVSVSVEDINRDPVANAGPDQSAKENRPVTLSGSGSDPEGDPVTFQWSQISGPSVSLDNADTPQAKFKAPKVDQNTVLVFRLAVRDDHGAEATDDTRVTLMDNRPPGVSAAISSQAVGFEEPVVLQGQASDPDGDPLQYSWIQTGGTPVQLAGVNSLKATFVAPSEETMLTFEFTATDQEFTSNVSLPVQVLPGNRDPRVQAGPDLVVRERLVGKLSATATDPDGDNLTYAWRQTGGPTVELVGATHPHPSFTAPETDADQFLTFEVVVSDGQGGTAVDNQLVTVTNNLPPKVDAGADSTVLLGQNVQLIGSAEDPNGDDLSYGWVQISGPRVALDKPYRDSTSFTAPNAEGVLVFRLTANDDEFRSDDTVSLKVVSAVPLTFPARVEGPEFGGMFVGLALANLRDRSTGVTLSGLDGTGFEMGRQELTTLAPLGQNAFLAGDFPDLSENSTSLLAIGSESQLRGFFMVGDWAGESLDGVGGELKKALQLTFPIAKRGEGENTLIYLFNPNTEGNSVSLRLYTPDGTNTGETEVTLAPNGSVSATMDDFFGPGIENEDGYIEVVGNLPVRGFELYRRPRGLLSAAGTPFTPVTRLSAPHFFVDEAGGGSELRLLSGSTRQAELTVTAFDDNGQQIGVYEGELAPHEMFVRDVGELLQLDGSTARTGYLEIGVRSQPFGDPARVSGLITFQANHGEAMASLPLVSEGRTETQFLQVAQSAASRVFTGLTVLNPGETATDVTLEAFDENGVNTGHVEFTLQPGERLAGLLGDDLYFGPEFEQVKGHLRLTSSAPVNAFALFGDYNLNYFAALEGQ